ncbi:SDR family NAD(P)-dependent oxidoreductase [Williamsia muralis]|uniref:Cyclopentanol dehydrogenase n=1 Tax=Williamsia marianensis TaxID=85044 RepID=A0A2G3PNL6_WILMA|nr:SDR family oxidoreductase [Williamsia marianensis]PHV67394.1 cyclopentanol dehydrogenase [Williamsia marianensis]
MKRLEGKVAIVTGAGRVGNIGLAVCEAFLREGCTGVVGTDFRTDEAEQINERISAEFGEGRFLLLQHDVTSAEGWTTVVDATVREFGVIDILVNNAGISVHGGVASSSLEDIRRVMAVNHDALLLGMQACLEQLLTAHERFAGGGVVINNLSMSSYMSNPNNLAYSVSKAAGRMLTLCAADELGPQRVRVNSVHPGLTMTPLIEEALVEYVDGGLWSDRDAAEAAISSAAPLNTSSRPEDTAHAFVYLASEEARFVTGASLYHDGGIGRRF